MDIRLLCPLAIVLIPQALAQLVQYLDQAQRWERFGAGFHVR